MDYLAFPAFVRAGQYETAGPLPRLFLSCSATVRETATWQNSPLTARERSLRRGRYRPLVVVERKKYHRGVILSAVVVGRIDEPLERLLLVMPILQDDLEYFLVTQHGGEPIGT